MGVFDSIIEGFREGQNQERTRREQSKAAAKAKPNRTAVKVGRAIERMKPVVDFVAPPKKKAAPAPQQKRKKRSRGSNSTITIRHVHTVSQGRTKKRGKRTNHDPFEMNAFDF